MSKHRIIRSDIRKWLYCTLLTRCDLSSRCFSQTFIKNSGTPTRCSTTWDSTWQTSSANKSLTVFEMKRLTIIIWPRKSTIHHPHHPHLNNPPDGSTANFRRRNGHIGYHVTTDNNDDEHAGNTNPH